MNDQLYIVVCKDLHGAVGLLTSAEDAIKIARAMNKQAGNKCDHVPVPITILQTTQVGLASDKPVKDFEPRGYL